MAYPALPDAPHPADILGDHLATGGDPGAMDGIVRILAREREMRVGERWHAIVARHPDGDRVSIAPVPDLAETLELLTGPVAVVDTETTGLHPHLGDRVASVGIVEGRVAGEGFRETMLGYERRVNPGRPSGEGARAVHGMDDADLAAEPPFRAIAAVVALRLADRVVVAQNAPFDVDFLDLEFARTTIEGVTGSARAIVDTRVVSSMLWPGEPAGLDALVERLGVERAPRTGFHGALTDARLLARCLPGLVFALRARLDPAPQSPGLVGG